MAASDATFIGQVASVAGNIVHVRLHDDIPTVVLIEGQSHRIGQIGAFLRIPLGYVHLYGVCTQVGASAIPTTIAETLLTDGIEPREQSLRGYRWMTIALVGESVGRRFSRGVGQHPTIGDEVHVATETDIATIYGTASSSATVTIGTTTTSSAIPANLDLAALVTRHVCIVGSTGSGKSNLVSVLLHSLGGGEYPGARAIVIDPHGEYASALKGDAQVLKAQIRDAQDGGNVLRVPFWALRASDLLRMTMGELQPNVEAAFRERIATLKEEAIAILDPSVPVESITADSPVPFSMKQIWFEFDDFERKTFRQTANQDGTNETDKIVEGNAEALRSNIYAPATSYNTAPFQNQRRRNILRQLDLLKNRLQDSRFSFLFDPGAGFSPSLDGRVEADLDELLKEWVSDDKPITIFDTSDVPAEVEGTIVATVLRLIYDAVLWSGNTAFSGRKRPLLVFLEEAHRFLRRSEGARDSVDSHDALQITQTIAREGRKYGVGLIVVSQRPSDVDPSILSQCGTFIALRLANFADRSVVRGSLPDDLGGLMDIVPGLRTGEAIVTGEAVGIPTRVRIFRYERQALGDDPDVVAGWSAVPNTTEEDYKAVIKNWRSGTVNAPEQEDGDA